MLVGDAVLFVLGFLWLLALGSAAYWLDQANLVGSAFAKAVQPFLLWDALKMIFAAITVAGAWALFAQEPRPDRHRATDERPAQTKPRPDRPLSLVGVE